MWINLIQDSLAALALATEKPTDALLNEKPPGRVERLITPVMWRNMFCNTVFQLSIIFFLLYYGAEAFDIQDNLTNEEKDYKRSKHYTLIFNTFVFLQLFNEINSRKLDKGKDLVVRNMQNGMHSKASSKIGVVLLLLFLQLFFKLFWSNGQELLFTLWH